ncbi:hypothetical protein FWC63_03320 [Candidatus Saccharibacteria bacterium]|nr:hypothetical protein [Candidatus Saccharibacteria bacterium]
MPKSGVSATPKRTKQGILDYLKSRGGILRSGPFEVWQVLYWRCFQRDREGSHHYDIGAVKRCVLELESEDKVILRRSGESDNKKCHYIALKSFDSSTTKVSGELNNTELIELFKIMSADYFSLERQLEDAKGETQVALDLAEQSEKVASTALAERDKAITERDKALGDAEKAQNTASYDGASKILHAQEAELTEARLAKGRAELEVAGKAAEITRLVRELETTKGQLTSNQVANQKITDKLQSKITDLSNELKRVREETNQTIGELRDQVAKFEKGNGLTAEKAIAATMHDVYEAFVHSFNDVIESTIEGLYRFIPEDKREAFRKEVLAAHSKLSRRK